MVIGVSGRRLLWACAIAGATAFSYGFIAGVVKAFGKESLSEESNKTNE